MKTGTVLVATLALASFPLVVVAQQSAPESSPGNPPATQPNSPAEQQRSSPANEPERPGTSAASATATVAAPVEMRAVKGELINKLDTKTAKTGDDVAIQTNAAVKTADGTEIPKGSKLTGHVLAVQSSGAGKNAQVVLRLDHAELSGGQSLPIQSQIQAIGPASGESAPSEAAATNGSSPAMNGASGSASSATSSPGASSPGYAPNPAPSAAGASSGAASGTSGPAAGTVVARTGNIAIRATSIPGVLLANNEPGQQDPRMAQASSILLGAQKDVQLEKGTPVVIGVSAAAAGATNAGGVTK
jgi:hypothetical protein